MEFTRDGYLELLRTIRGNGYAFTDFGQAEDLEGVVLLRHDVDFSLQAAVELSELEYREQVPATYFVLVRTDFYNICSRRGRQALRQIRNNGGRIGLHFDVSQHWDRLPPRDSKDYCGELNRLAQRERQILEDEGGMPISAIAFHRPSQEDIQLDVSFAGMRNAYGQTYFRKFKYLSDSSMHWREDVDTILRERQYTRLQILTHPFWYPLRDLDLAARLRGLCRIAVWERYQNLSENFQGLGQVLPPEELEV